MFDVRKFDAQLALRNISRKELAEYLGISEATMYRKIKSGGRFSRDEINKMIDLLEIEEPMTIFFTNKLS